MTKKDGDVLRDNAARYEKMAEAYDPQGATAQGLQLLAAVAKEVLKGSKVTVIW